MNWLLRLKQTSNNKIEKLLNPAWLTKLEHQIKAWSDKAKALSFRSLTTDWFHSMSITALIISSRIMTEMDHGFFEILPAIVTIYLSMIVIWVLKLQFYWYNIIAYCVTGLLLFISEINMFAALAFSLVFTGIQLLVLLAVSILQLLINVTMALVLVLILQTILGIFDLLPSDYIVWTVLIFSLMLYFNRKMWHIALLVMFVLASSITLIMWELRQTSWIVFPSIWEPDTLWNLICYFAVSSYCTACLTAYFAIKFTFLEDSQQPEPIQPVSV